MSPISSKNYQNISHKIDATRYFLSKMRENEDDILRFRFNLVAFLCLADSARETIKELDEEWYRKHPLYSDILWNYFLKLRDVSLHVQAPNPKRTVWTTLTCVVSIAGENEMKSPKPKTPEPKTKATGGCLYYFELLDGDLTERIKKNVGALKIDQINQAIKKTDVFTLCNDFLKKIETLWDDYQNQHN
jgi:hypothetical protein